MFLLVSCHNPEAVYVINIAFLMCGSISWNLLILTKLTDSQLTCDERIHEDGSLWPNRKDGARISRDAVKGKQIVDKSRANRLLIFY